MAAAAASSPFDIGAAWKRMASAFPISINFLSQYAIVLRCAPYHLATWQQASACQASSRQDSSLSALNLRALP